MKKKYVLTVLLLLIIYATQAQKQLLGMTQNGGHGYGGGYGFGTIFKTDSVGGNPVVMHYFDSTNGMRPNGPLFQASNGKLYGVATEGGLFTGNTTGGVLFEYDLAIDSFKVVFQFGNPDLPNGASPVSGVIEPIPGMLFGSTGGGRGKIYKYNINTGNISLSAIIPNFQSQLSIFGNYLNGELVKASNGLLYGATALYSACPDGAPFLGSIISLNPTNNAYNTVFPFNCTSADGWNPNGSLVEGLPGKLYGTTITGGLNIGLAPLGPGILFEYNTLTNTYTKKINFIDSIGFAPGPLILGANNKLYGLLTGGGINTFDTTEHLGSLYEYDPLTNTVTVKHNFGLDGAGGFTGYGPNGFLLKASTGNLYGMSSVIGIFEYNPIADTVILKSRWDSNPDFYAGGPGYTGLIEICRKPAYTYFYTDSFSICENNSFNYTVHSNNARSYQWNKAGSAIVAQTDSIIQFNNMQVSDAGIYTCTMTNECGQTITMDLVVTVNALPTVSITPVPANLCEGESIVLNGNGAVTYTWSDGINNNTGFIPPVGTTTYTVTGTDANGCSNTNSQTVVVNPNISATISISSNVNQGSNGGPVIYTALTNLIAPYIINWYRNNIFQTSTTTNSWNTTIASGNNFVKAIISSTSQCLEPDSVESNVLDIKSIDGLSIYPNPTTGDVIITGLMPNDNIGLYNSVGQRLLTTTGTTILSDQNKLRLTNFASGTYMLSIKRNEEIFIKKIIKMAQ